MTLLPSAFCPCGSKTSYVQCCMSYHIGTAVAPNALALMRSRYTAYALANAVYLKMTWHPDTLPVQLSLDTEARWLGLKIIQHANSDDDHASVEFVARYKINGRAHRLHEMSRFVQVRGCWFYFDGVVKSLASPR